MTNTSPEDSVEFSLDLTRAAIITVEQTNKDGDLLAADDVARVVVPPPKALSVLLVTDGELFLRAADRKPADSEFQGDVADGV